MYFRVHAPELSAGSDGKGPQYRFPGKVVSHGTLMHHSQMPRRLPLRVVNGNGQVALYPIFLHPMILLGTSFGHGRLPCQGIPDRRGYQIACFWTQKRIQIVLPRTSSRLRPRTRSASGLNSRICPFSAKPMITLGAVSTKDRKRASLDPDQTPISVNPAKSCPSVELSFPIFTCLHSTPSFHRFAKVCYGYPDYGIPTESVGQFSDFPQI
jgi:hypothetical protein